MARQELTAIRLRMLSDMIRRLGPAYLAPREVERLRLHLMALTRLGHLPPGPGLALDWQAIAQRCEIAPPVLRSAAVELDPALATLWRQPALAAATTPSEPAPTWRRGVQRKTAALEDPPAPRRDPATPDHAVAGDPRDFAAALDEAMTLGGDTPWILQKALLEEGVCTKVSTLTGWRLGKSTPSQGSSFEVLRALEARWGLPPGHFRSLLGKPLRAMRRGAIDGLSRRDRRRLAWHLPEDFDQRSPAEREEILHWIRNSVLAGTTDYCRYQSTATRQPYGLLFLGVEARAAAKLLPRRTGPNPRRATAAPAALVAELNALIAFKSAALTPLGFERDGIWGAQTVAQKVRHFSLLFGALAGAEASSVRGRGAPLDALTFALLAFPQVWDWYLDWRRERRGFLTSWELDMLAVVAALCKPRTGWMTQSPSLTAALRPIESLLSAADIAQARADWPETCVAFRRYAQARMRDVRRLVRVHRDPFETILPVLEADSPVGEYSKIADEILAHRPCAKRSPKPAAESTRAFLMIRLALHLGWRQRNLRELLLCRPGDPPRSEGQLAALGRGELRWSDQRGGWEVYAPASAFKNAGSRYFGGRPFRLQLPDVGGLYDEIDAYVTLHRPRLLGGLEDEGVFFVKTVQPHSAASGYDQNTFYETWRAIIMRYGIHNPYTGRGAIAGLLPHGPHRVRDVLATHVLKQTGSYDQASYAIQDSPKTVAQHYTRFQPQDKAAIAAQVLNQVWAPGR